MTLLQQQGSSTHNSSHVNQIGTMTGSSHVLTGNVSSISCSMSKAGESGIKNDPSIIDRTASIIAKMDNHINTMRSRIVEKYS